LIFILARHDAEERSHTTPLNLDTRGSCEPASSGRSHAMADAAVAAALAAVAAVA